MPEFPVTIAEHSVLGGVYSWSSQAEQYPAKGRPGIGYFAGWMEGRDAPVNCLLYRHTDGSLIGILNHFPIDMDPFEQAGNICIWVKPQFQRRGIATALLTECVMRYGHINFSQQVYSKAGAALASAFINGTAVHIRRMP